MKIDLPSGGWVLLRDPMTVKARDRKRVLLALDGVDGRFARQFTEADTVLALAVAEWSFTDLPLPSEQPDSLDELSIADYDALCVAAKPFEQALFPDFSDEATSDPKEEPPPGI